ncbi:MAG: transglutaminase-like domain-containing protein, partial [Clostridia bacterium]|nr:transglutaminase-like domain-containing protein [Clostridia bacterium]
LQLLECLNSKDLTDTASDTLVDHLLYSIESKDKYEEKIYVKYIMCPRVYYEMIRPYKQYFQEKFSIEEIIDFRKDPVSLVQWVKEHIEVLNNYTYYSGYATPIGSFELCKADSFSRNILFVALARSFGIPARLESKLNKPQYYKNGKWMDAFIRTGQYEKKKSVGRVKLTKSNYCDIKMQYYHNFSLAKLEDGVFKSLDYHKTDSTYFENFFELTSGYYRLITGTRLTDGTTLIRIKLFEVKGGQKHDINIMFRKDSNEVENLGSISELENLQLLDKKEDNKITINKTTVLVWIEPDKEPSKHFLREYRELIEDFKLLNSDVFICIGEDKLTSAFNHKTYNELGGGTPFRIDKSYRCLNSITQKVTKNISNNYPIVFVLDKNKTIRYASSGYKIGVVNQILKVIGKLEYFCI